MTPHPRPRWLGLLLLAALCFASAAWATEARRMTKEELRPLLEKGEAVVIDVRAGGDWNSSNEKIARAVREAPGDEAAWAGKYPKDKVVVLYCA